MASAILLAKGSHAERMLETYLGKRVRLGRRAWGAPYIENDPHYVSISHKDDYLAVAVSDSPVGVDIEKIEAKKSHMRIARRYFGEKVEDAEGFFRGWTKREALGKRLGVGLTQEVMLRTIEGDTIELDGDTVYFDEYVVDGYMITVCGSDPHAELIGGQQNE